MSSLNLQSFRVERLFGGPTLELPFVDNRLVIVGENGSGKSTVINLLFQLITAQWGKLASMPCSSVTLSANGASIHVERERLRSPSPRGARLPRTVQKHLELRLRQLDLFDREPDDPAHHFLLRELARDVGIPPHILRLHLSESEPVDSNQYSEEQMEELSTALDRLVEGQVLFLPTYRRIERDLKTIFPELKLDRDMHLNERARARGGRSGYLELVEFGMHDVEEAFTSTSRDLDKVFRAQLNNLTAEYLRDIIRSDYETVDMDILKKPEVPLIVSETLGRMDDETLPLGDRKQVTDLIGALGEGKDIDFQEKVVLHFVSKLIKIHEEQRKREEKVRKLAEVCNRYLGRKEVRFDSQQFDLYLARLSSEGSEAGRIPPSVLSSGEKQILSLFTHIYLSGESNFFVLIDEPELSISVPWQRTFLPDILNSGLCGALIAVTHSPFIFENELEACARSMEEFVRGES